MKHPIPREALDDRLAFVGTAGSGKTYNAGTGVESLLYDGAKVIIIDPLGVWYGLRLLPNGITPSSLNVAIFGGAHGDLPLTEQAGAIIGETAATMAESCIIDLSQIGTKAGERRFMLAFLTSLYRRTAGQPLHIVIDEADMFAPQRLMDKDGDAAKLLGMMETIVRRGRVKGFIPWLITQRPAVLSKDVLSQADGLIAFKLTSSQDRDAIGAWIEGQADQKEGKAILASLPQMQTGQGVIWIPGRNVLTTAQFPKKATFDSSRTPKRGEAKHTASLKPLDLGRLKDRLASVEKEASANDPRALRTRIAVLERDAGKPTIDAKAIEQAERSGFDVGFDAGVTAAANAWSPILDAIRSAVPQTLPVPPRPKNAPPAPTAPAAHVTVHRKAQEPPRPHTESGVALPKAARLILTALAQHGDRTKSQIAILTGYAVNGGGFNNILSLLRTAQYIGDSSGQICITSAGLERLGAYDPLPTGRALLDHWLRQLGKAERAALYALAEIHPAASTKEQIAEVTGYKANGGGFNNALSRLRTLELITGRGEIRASDALIG